MIQYKDLVVANSLKLPNQNFREEMQSNINLPPELVHGKPIAMVDPSILHQIDIPKRVSFKHQ
jgi:hypothetical protein